MGENKKALTNGEIAAILRAVAAVYLLKGENRFRIIAYEKAADSLENLSRELKDVWQEGRLEDIPGLGASISGHLDELFRKGRSKYFEGVLKKVPAGVFYLMKIPSIGPKTALKLITALKLESSKDVFEDLRKAAEKDKIAALPGFGHKSQEEILGALEMFKTSSVQKGAPRMPLPYASTIAEQVLDYLRNLKMIKRMDVLGSLRRGVSTIGDIDIAVQAADKDSNTIIEHFINYPKKLKIDNKGAKKASLIIFPGIRVDLRVQDEATYGSMLQYFTGSKRHNIQLREYALKKGLSLNEYGIKEVKSGKLREFATEKAFYEYLGLDYIPPEIREGTHEIDAAKTGKIPLLVDFEDIRGDFHIHSSYDLKPSHDFGNHSYQELAHYAKKRGLSYIGFSDHNPKISGHTADDIVRILKKRKEHIDKGFKAKPVLPYFIGLEVDIQPTGELAVPRDAYEYVDYMIVSVHSSFHMDVSAMTKRVLKALDEPKVKILAHPTGRLIDKREGYELEWSKVFETCAKKNIAVEINAWPQRLDLPDSLVRQAIRAGAKLFINTDAHDISHMDNLAYGVSVARRGWAAKGDIINTRSYTEVKKWLEL